MVDEMETMFAGLREILQHAAKLKKEGRLDFLTMGEISDLAAR